MLLNNSGQIITNQRRHISVIDAETGDIVNESVTHTLNSSYCILTLSKDHERVFVLTTGYGKIPVELAAWTIDAIATRMERRLWRRGESPRPTGFND